MQINGIGNSQIGNAYQNSNQMPHSAAGKKEEEDAAKRLEALGVKVELSFRQQEPNREEVENQVDIEKAQEEFSVISWVKKIWEAGIAWLKSIWNDEPKAEMTEEPLMVEQNLVEESAAETVAEASTETSAEAESSEIIMTGELIEETVVSNDADGIWIEKTESEEEKQWPDETLEDLRAERYRSVGVALHRSGMQDSYNKYGQPSKLGVEPSGNMTIRK